MAGRFHFLCLERVRFFFVLANPNPSHGYSQSKPISASCRWITCRFQSWTQKPSRLVHTSFVPSGVKAKRSVCLVAWRRLVLGNYPFDLAEERGIAEDQVIADLVTEIAPV